MKNIFFTASFFVASSIALLSCNDDRHDDFREVVSSDKLKIDSVKIVSDTMTVNSVQSIRTYSTYGSSCQGFDGYDYQKDNLTRTVTAYSFTTDGPCTQATEVRYNQFNFQPQTSGTYMFKFWNGKDTAGTDLWITKNIVVK